MTAIERILVVGVAGAMVGLTACGGSLSGSSTDAGHQPTADAVGHEPTADAENLVDGGTDSGLCGTPIVGEVPPEHRPASKTCALSLEQPPVPDAGLLSCTTNLDCGGGINPTAQNEYTTCLHGQCSFDQCLTDDDCGPNAVCACSTDYYGGNARYHPNVCVPANCHVDSDCGAGGYCSPSRGTCGTFQGFYCHGPKDTCVDSAQDCTACGGNSCLYSPAYGAFICGSSVCAG